MRHEHPSDAEIDGWLNTLGITSLCQWDVAVFLYRHHISLVGANLIAHLLGYANAPVVAALDTLELLGLADRSRVSQVVRLYQFTVPSDPQRSDAWTRLLALASHRVGRVRLAGRLRGGEPTAQAERDEIRHLLTETHHSVQASQQGLEETRHLLTEARQSIRESRCRLHPHGEGEELWPKAI